MNIPDLNYREFDPPCEDVVVQKIALYRTKMTANLQNENGPL